MPIRSFQEPRRMFAPDVHIFGKAAETLVTMEADQVATQFSSTNISIRQAVMVVLPKLGMLRHPRERL